MSLVFVNITDNHSKVWGFNIFSKKIPVGNGCHTEELELTTYWGRIGLDMHQLRKRKKIFIDYFDLREFIIKKIDDKKFKGYKEMENWEYFSNLENKSILLKKIKDLYN